MKQYAVTITRWNEDDTQNLLVDRFITADQAVDLMLSINEMPEEIGEQEEEAEEIEEPEPVQTKPPKKTKPGKTVRTCKKCGEAGHNARTCMNQSRPRIETTEFVDEDFKPKRGKTVADDDTPWFYTEVLSLKNKGMNRQEVLDEVGIMMTLAQFQEAWEWASNQ